EVVLHPHDRRRARAGSDGDVIEAELVERVFDGQRPAESHTAIHAQVAAPLERDADDFQKVLVPANGDAVLRHAAGTREDALVELVPKYPRVADRLARVEAERLDLQAIDRDDAEAFVREVV